VSNSLLLEWLPAPADFAGDLKAAALIGDPSLRLDALCSLAGYRLTFLDTLQLDRALERQSFDKLAGYSHVRLAILGSSTLDHLVPGIRVAGVRRRVRIATWLGAYGQYRQELLDPPATLRSFAPEFVLLSLTAREALAVVPLTAGTAEAAAAIRRYVAEHCDLWRQIKNEHGATPIQQTFVDTTDAVFGSLDRGVPGSPAEVVRRLNDQLVEAAAAQGVLILDIGRAVARHGQQAWFDRARWFQAKQEIAPRAACWYGELVARLLAAQRGLSKKCLVLDLDNTLWRGVVGDDGIDGIVLGEGNPVGEAHAALQRYALTLRERGVVLAVCSKNDLATAEEVFDKHPEMILRRSDISVFIANWNDKADNLRTIADRLNIGLDSLVFVDDNPVERARVRQALPMVSVPELPEDAAEYTGCVAEAGYFEAVGFTPDDTQRVAQYTANAERDALREGSASLEEFLRGLEMSVEYCAFAAADLPRVAQLINKTNQFNPTMQRVSADDVVRFATTARYITMQFRLVDRFGDNGLVSAAVLAPEVDQADAMRLVSWVMSCRVFGRELEFEVMNILIEAAAERGVRRLCASYVPAPRNGAISELFATLGFARTSEVENTSRASEWTLILDKFVPKATHIQRRRRAAELASVAAADSAPVVNLQRSAASVEHR
jgi:FkbH-like protein